MNAIAWAVTAALGVSAVAVNLPDTPAEHPSLGGFLPGESFGASVALVGKIAIVSAYSDNANGTNSGSAHAFRQRGSLWEWDGALTPSDAAAGQLFGWNVATSGKYAIVGAITADGMQELSGAAYIFKKVRNQWVQEDKILYPGDDTEDLGGDAFGAAVAITDQWAIVGAPGWDQVAGPNGGACVFFRRQSDATWVWQSARFGVGGAQFGASVAVDGKLAAIGAPGQDDTGGVLVRRLTPNGWTDAGVLSPFVGSSGGEFGASVAVSGKLIAVGAPEHAGGGKVHIFSQGSNFQWEEIDAFRAPTPVAGDHFGASIAISGTTVLVGAPGAGNDNGAGAGTVYVFRPDSARHWQVAGDPLLADDGAAGHHFGDAVALDKSTALIGAPDAGGGAVYVFR